MTVDIPDSVLSAAGLTHKELLLKLALILFKEERLTLGQASKLAGLHQLDFQKELAAREIPIHYGLEEFRNDLDILGLAK